MSCLVMAMEQFAWIDLVPRRCTHLLHLIHGLWPASLPLTAGLGKYCLAILLGGPAKPGSQDLLTYIFARTTTTHPPYTDDMRRGLSKNFMDVGFSSTKPLVGRNWLTATKCASFFLLHLKCLKSQINCTWLPPGPSQSGKMQKFANIGHHSGELALPLSKVEVKEGFETDAKNGPLDESID
jgi:hypothetical protein